MGARQAAGAIDLNSAEPKERHLLEEVALFSLSFCLESPINGQIQPKSHLTGPSVFDLSVSGRPGGSEEAGGREKTKTGKQGPGGGPGAPRVLRPSAKVG